MEFSIQGKTLSFSDNQIEIAKILKHYHKLASEGREVARVLLIARKFTPIQFVKNGDNFALAIIGSYGEQVIQDFINKGFFSYDESKLKKDFEDTFNFNDEWEELIAPMVEIIQKNQDTQLYREFRKEERGRVVGGGFGLEGALKGFVAAGALNMASDIGHSIFNSIANAIDETSQETQLKELFNEDLIDDYLELVYDGIYSFGKVFVQKLVDYDFMDPDDLGNLFNEGKQKEYWSIFLNLLKNRIPETERVNVALHLIESSPYEHGEYYEYLKKNVADHDADQVVAMKSMMYARNSRYALSDFSEDVVKPTEFDIAVGQKIEKTYGIRISILFEGKKEQPKVEKKEVKKSSSDEQKKDAEISQAKSPEKTSIFTAIHGCTWFVVVAVAIAIALNYYNHPILSNLSLLVTMAVDFFIFGIGIFAIADMWGHITNQKQTIFEEMGKNSDSVFFAKASGGSFVITLITLIMFVVMLFICRIHYFTITFWFMVAAGLINLLILPFIVLLGLKNLGDSAKKKSSQNKQKERRNDKEISEEKENEK